MKEALLVDRGFVEVTQPKQFPVQRSVTADPNEMLTLKFCGMQLEIPISIQRDTLSMIIEVTAHAQ